MKKYVFRPYSKIFPELFQKEKDRIAFQLKPLCIIEHIGSTAIVGLGGKGIIDIGIATNKEDMEIVSRHLQELGYEFRPTYSTSERFYFIIYLPDPEEGIRRYHMHLTYPDSQDWKSLIGFRDYLRSHPEEVHAYAEIKKVAALEANHDGETYRRLKSSIFKKIAGLIS